MKRTVATVSAFLAVYFVIATLFQELCGMQPRDYTRTNMWCVKRRILRFAHENGRLPMNLVDLPKMPGLSNETVDWWGNPIQFEVTHEGVVILRSAGGNVRFKNAREGMPLICRFPTKAANGGWSDELIPFLTDGAD